MTPFTFLRKQHPKRDEDGYLYTSRHIRVLFAYFLAQKLEVLRPWQRNVYYWQDGWAFVFRRLQEQIERTAEFPSAKDSVVPLLMLNQFLPLGKTISSAPDKRSEPGSFEPLWAGFRDHFDRGHLHIVFCLRYVLLLLRLYSRDGRASDRDLVTDMRRQVGS
jgi:hypothetical protein